MTSTLTSHKEQSAPQKSNVVMREKYRKECDALIRRVKRYYHEADADILNRACQFSYNAHKDQLRRSGKPYFEHALEVAKILSYLRLDLITIVGGLLHDVPEDTGATIEDVEDQFGPEFPKY